MFYFCEEPDLETYDDNKWYLENINLENSGLRKTSKKRDPVKKNNNKKKRIGKLPLRKNYFSPRSQVTNNVETC